MLHALLSCSWAVYFILNIVSVLWASGLDLGLLCQWKTRGRNRVLWPWKEEMRVCVMEVEAFVGDNNSLRVFYRSLHLLFGVALGVGAPVVTPARQNKGKSNVSDTIFHWCPGFFDWIVSVAFYIFVDIMTNLVAAVLFWFTQWITITISFTRKQSILLFFRFFNCFISVWWCQLIYSTVVNTLDASSLFFLLQVVWFWIGFLIHACIW